MSKLYTGNGDDGGTVLFDGTRVRKDHPRVEAYGAVDEVNACLGLAASLMADAGPDSPLAPIVQRVTEIQSELFTVGAELATPRDSRNWDKLTPLSGRQAIRLESWIDEASAEVAPLKTFILPGGSIIASQFHVCRTVCRRAERRVATVAERESVNEHVLVYLNRLGDLLFAWARLANRYADIPDVPWVDLERRPEASDRD